MEVSSTGRVSRVETKFAYLSTSKYGAIFVPPIAALPTDCGQADLTRFYKTGDIVHFRAVKQQPVKNGCAWLATKIQLSTKSEQYQHQGTSSDDSTIPNHLLLVTSVTETFAYGVSETLGDVFLPGAAFPNTIKRLNEHIAPGQTVRADLRSQSHHNSCNWIAVSAWPVDVDATSRRFRGTGTVRSVQDAYALVETASGTLIHCGMLAWTPSENSPLPHRDSLCLVVSPGDRVYFDAHRRLPVNDAASWTAMRWGREVPSADRRVRDAFTQTAPMMQELLWRSLDREMRETIREKAPRLSAFCFPQSANSSN